jgi:hypothetical protein
MVNSLSVKIFDSNAVLCAWSGDCAGAERSADAEFWNPKFRAPICYSSAAARTVLPPYIERTKWVLAGLSMSEMVARTRAELSAGTFRLPDASAMSHMMSKHGHPHDVSQ